MPSLEELALSRQLKRSPESVRESMRQQDVAQRLNILQEVQRLFTEDSFTPDEAGNEKRREKASELIAKEATLTAASNIRKNEHFPYPEARDRVMSTFPWSNFEDLLKQSGRRASTENANDLEVVDADYLDEIGAMIAPLTKDGKPISAHRVWEVGQGATFEDVLWLALGALPEPQTPGEKRSRTAGIKKVRELMKDGAAVQARLAKIIPSADVPDKGISKDYFYDRIKDIRFRKPGVILPTVGAVLIRDALLRVAAVTWKNNKLESADDKRDAGKQNAGDAVDPEKNPGFNPYDRVGTKVYENAKNAKLSEADAILLTMWVYQKDQFQIDDMPEPPQEVVEAAVPVVAEKPLTDAPRFDKETHDRVREILGDSLRPAQTSPEEEPTDFPTPRPLHEMFPKKERPVTKWKRALLGVFAGLFAVATPEHTAYDSGLKYKADISSPEGATTPKKNAAPVVTAEPSQTELRNAAIAEKKEEEPMSFFPLIEDPTHAKLNVTTEPMEAWKGMISDRGFAPENVTVETPEGIIYRYEFHDGAWGWIERAPDDKVLKAQLASEEAQ